MRNYLFDQYQQYRYCRIISQFLVGALFLVGILFFYFSNGYAQLGHHQKFSPYLEHLLKHFEVRSLAKSLPKNFAFEIHAPQAISLSVFIEKEKNSGVSYWLESIGAHVNTDVGKICTATVPLEILPAVASDDRISYIDIANYAWPVLDTSISIVGTDAVQRGDPPLPHPYDGENVIIGVIDSGIDVSHPDFLNPDGTTRILYLWDQTTPGAPPSGFSYGTEWNQEEINADICTEKDGPAHYGHGTHVAAIVASNGVALNLYKGMAPQADLIVVKTDFSFTHIVDGVSYVFSRADELDKAAVVNLSLSGQQGPHDDTSLTEQALNELVKAGRIVVAAASNEGNKPIHVAHTLADEEIATEFVAKNNEDEFVYLDIWYPPPGNLEVAIAGLNKNSDLLTPTSWVTPGQQLWNYKFTRNDTTYGIISIDARETANPLNGDRHVFIEINNDNQQYDFSSAVITWVLKLRGSGSFDAWICNNNGQFGTFTGTLAGLNFIGGDTEKTVGIPGTASRVVTVGSFTSKNCWTDYNGQTWCLKGPPTIGDISGFSSRGPTRDGRLKPELTAPGEVIAAAMSKDANLETTIPHRVLQGEMHVVFQGTSMATPHVTGAVALLLEHNPQLTPEEVKHLLTITAQTDTHTTALPNNTWGYGKLDAFAALSRLITEVPDEIPLPQPQDFVLEQNYPNPFFLSTSRYNDEYNKGTTIEFVLRGKAVFQPVTLQIVNTLGQVVRKMVKTSLPPGRHYYYWDGRDENDVCVAAGLYFYRLRVGEIVRTRKLLVMP